MSTVLYVDVQYLAHRAYHTTGGLAHNGRPTGVIYGVLRELEQLKLRFGPCRFAFCFDSKKSLRAEKFLWYKANRVKLAHDPGNVGRVRTMRDQVKTLRHDVLPGIGYRNVFHADGYEGDDLIASLVAGGRRAGDTGHVCVSADKDLLQLLDDDLGTTMYRPQTKDVLDAHWFRRNYAGLPPGKWRLVKALGGCTSDNVRGAPRVGEPTAVKYLAGRLAAHTTAYKSCEAFAKTQQYRNNLEVVTLPYAGCPQLSLAWEPKVLDPADYARVLEKYGIRTLGPDAVPRGNRHG